MASVRYYDTGVVIEADIDGNTAWYMSRDIATREQKMVLLINDTGQHTVWAPDGFGYPIAGRVMEKPMNIYLLKREDPDWGEMVSVVVCAKTEASARQHTKKKAYGEGPEAWDTCPCTLIGIAVKGIEPGIVLDVTAD